MLKRLVVAALSALALVLGLVGGPATAGDPYPGPVKTATSIKAPKVLKPGKSAKVTVKVVSPGSGRPEGRVTLTVKGPGGHDRTVRGGYDGRAVSFDTGKLAKPGKYKLLATFDGGDSVFRSSKDSAVITVKRPKKD